MIRVFDYEKLPIVDVVNEIIMDSVNKGASDIHIDPSDEIIKVRIRIDGELIEYTQVPATFKKNLTTRIKIISGMNITETRLPQDGAIKTKLQDKQIDLRVSCLPTNIGEKIVIRILDFGMSQKGLETLGFSHSNFKKIDKMIASPNGIILVTGATGSGKSTTVYSMLQKLNKEDVNLISVEDPVEMEIDGINQVQVYSDIGLTFASVLRSILRQDPDIIMIGEIRDDETAKIAVRASITGHLVLSTIHTNNSLNTIERLLDMDVERYLLASALTGIVSQKLARRLCNKCKTAYTPNDYEKKLLKKALNQDVNTLYMNNGCNECSLGFKGRIPVHEVLLLNDEIRSAISTGSNKEKLRKLVYTGDVTTMLQDGLQKAVEGHTTLGEILRLIELEDDLDKEYSLDKALLETNYAQHKDEEIIEETIETASNNGINIPSFISNNIGNSQDRKEEIKSQSEELSENAMNNKSNVQQINDKLRSLRELAAQRKEFEKNDTL